MITKGSNVKGSPSVLMSPINIDLWMVPQRQNFFNISTPNYGMQFLFSHHSKNGRKELKKNKNKKKELRRSTLENEEV